MSAPKSTFPPDRLNELGAIYRERNAAYGDTYKSFGPIMQGFFRGEPVTLQSADDWNRMALFFHAADKLARYAGTFKNGGHVDSLDDLSVYSMLLQEYDSIIRERPSQTNRGYVLVDMDHTLSDAEWRDGIIIEIMEGGRGMTWDDYHVDQHKDAPLWDAVTLVSALKAHDFKIIIMTSRPEKWREQTSKWLFSYGVEFDELIMRPDDNHEASAVIKVDMAKRRFGERIDQIAMVVDDRADVCQAFRAMGVTAIQVHRCAGDRNEGH